MAGHVDELFSGLDADHALEVAHHHRERMRAEHGTDAVDRVVVLFAVCLKRGVDGLLERLQAVRHLDDVRAEHFHARDVRRLLFDVDSAHVDIAFQPEIRGSRCQRHAVLTGTGFGDHFLFAHVFREQRFAHAVVELVRAGMVQILALGIQLHAAAERVRQALQMRDRRRSALKFRADAPQLRDELAAQDGIYKRFVEGRREATSWKLAAGV